VVKAHLSGGGTMTDLDVEAARQKYASEYEKGKTVAKEASNNKEAGDVFEKLAKLGELRDKGVITEKDFEAKKAELLKEV